MSLNHAITLRPAGREDQAAIEALLNAHGLPLAGVLDHLSSFVVASSGAEVIGCAGLELHGQAALLRSVAVAPGLQKQGIGRRLVEHALERARRQPVQAVYLLTTTARDYFVRQGFALAERANAPQALDRSAEFQGACPASADLMVRTLSEPHATGIDALPIAVLGAGPVGLAAAARLIERGLPFFILEAGDRVGANLLDYGHVRLFSPWRYNVDHAMARLLESAGWTAPDAEELPLAGDIVAKVLRPFAALPRVAGVLHLRTRVVSVSREGFDKVKSAGRELAPFVIRAERDGQVLELRARAVIDATGTWNTPNPVGASGLPAIGESRAADRIFYGIPDVLGAQRSRYAGKKTLVVGAGHSAANTLLSLADLARQEAGTTLAWSVRSPVLTRVFGGGDADALPARGALGSALRRLRDAGDLDFSAGLRITEIREDGGRLIIAGVDAEGRPTHLSGIDQIVCATGQRPDLSLTSELRVKLDPWLESNEALGPLIDPNLHSCGTVRPHGHRELAHPEPGLYTVGVKSYGRAPTFLMATGFEQVRSVVAAIAGDFEAADRVELDLPETGVCSVAGSATEGLGANSCCGTAEEAQAPAAAAEARGCAATSCSAPAPAPAPAAKAAVAASSCCGGPAKADSSACCALDEQKKAEGAAGCGCSDPQAAVAAPRAKASSCCA